MAASVAAPSGAYEALCAKLKDVSSLSGVEALLEWDEMVIMPPAAAQSRANQKTAMAGVVHEKSTDPEIGELIEKVASQEGGLTDVQAALLREARRDYNRASRISKDLAQRRARLSSDGHHAWLKAREAKDWGVFAPVLQQIVELTREIGTAVSPEKTPYDAALDEYEKSMSSARIDEVFTELKAGVVPLVAAIRKAIAERPGSVPDASWLQGDYDVKAQAALCEALVKDLGFSTERGRLDVSVHPFTGGPHPTDVRMTTRFKPHDLMEGLTGAVHECGHALYEQGRPAEHDGLPISAAVSLGVHESQSLLWERMVALSPPFCEFLLPRIRDSFPAFGAGKNAQDLYAAVNAMRVPSLVRVEADEVTYPLHVIMRYEIERNLLEGSLAAADVPAAWNERMRAYLGCEPADDVQGCLQDIHWSMGALGYFPTYTLGAMYAAQIFAAAQMDMPSLQSDVKNGKFEGLREWLREKVHMLGSLPANGDELMKAVTGSTLDVSIFVKYLNKKYTALYGLETE